MWLHRLREAGAAAGVPLVAAGDVHMHVRSRKPLQDVLTAVRLGRPLTACGIELQPNAERHLRSRLRLAQTYPAELLAQTLRVAERCAFSLDELRYRYPDEVVPEGHTPSSWLRRLAWEGAGRRWPQGVPAALQTQIEHELALIDDLGYQHYFLTVADIVDFARSRGILCQGRGSAANSVVCYCLGVTEVDPARLSVLFERFISRERNEPPDIDIDFEHGRREEVIQYLYRRYGRDRAALAAIVVRWRPRSALRDVGRALGFEAQAIDALAKSHQWWDGREIAVERLQEAGLDPEALAVRQLRTLDRAADRLSAPPQPASGRLRAHRRAAVAAGADRERRHGRSHRHPVGQGRPRRGRPAQGRRARPRHADRDLEGARLRRQPASAMRFGLHDIPAEDAATYDMICAADTVGVFQIESRAQQSMLPRLKPRCFYDLVIEVAIVRPGPIQGGMVHPYLRRREGLEPVDYPGEALRQALGRTLGVPVFQEQVMQVAILAAGFTPGEADGLRRAMAAWRRKGGLGAYREKIVDGMTARGYEAAFAERIFEQIRGFSEYGFPESHAASFALLVYASCWIKRHHPAEFLAAMLDSQPLGFYSPSQLVQDAVRHGVVVRPVDVMASGLDCTLEGLPRPPAVRLGLRLVGGLGAEAARRIVEARNGQPFDDAEDLARRAGLDRREMTLLAAADALHRLSGHRRQQVWDAAALRAAPLLLRDAPVEEDEPADLPAAPEGEAIVWDYASTGLTLRRHPLALLRPRLAARRLLSAEQLRRLPDGRTASACGIVTLRQQPDTANGVVFVSLEDETGAVQVIVWRRLRDAQRRVLLGSKLLAVHGVWQRQGEVTSLVAGRLEDLTPLLGRLATLGTTGSRDFR